MNISAREQRYTKMRLRNIIILLGCLLAVVMIAATALGSTSVPFWDTVRIILKRWGLIDFSDVSAGSEAIIYTVRFPRVVLTAMVGAALAVSGAAMQGMFRNPMADPGILGISSGAGLGAVIAIALGLAAKSIFLMPAFASVGALGAASVILVLSSRGGKVPAVNLILSGVAVSMFLGSIITITLMFIHGDQVKQFLFWSVGSLAGNGWDQVKMSVIPIMASTGALLFFSRDLNILLLGEEEAQSVGLNPATTRKILMLLTTIATASAVCVSGNISFVGLIVPHILRLIIGPDHRILMPASALGGAVFLVVCDLIGRTVLMPVEVGVGIITSLMGAPYFLLLLNKARKEGGIFQ